jgi:hypothetical protein
MRIAFTISGVAVVLFGVFLLSVFPFALGNAIKTSDNGAIIASCILPVIGFGFILTGKYFFRLDPDAEDTLPRASRVSDFLVDHRRDLKVLAQVGFLLSTIRLIAVCFDSDWPARQTTWFLLAGAFVLHYCGKKAANRAVTDNRDWLGVPTWIRRLLKPAQGIVSILVLGTGFLSISALWVHSIAGISHFVARVSLAAMIAFMYALTAVFFAYGELQSLDQKSDHTSI